MFNTIVGAGAASRYGTGSDQKMRLLAVPAPQHWFLLLSLILQRILCGGGGGGEGDFNVNGFTWFSWLWFVVFISHFFNLQVFNAQLYNATTIQRKWNVI
jgi:hypothetical protein